MRAVAITLVVLYHAGLTPISGGYVGVDVFFVISGYVITMTLGRELAKRGTISISGFYARRATRLLPAATAVIIATLVASVFWMPPLALGGIATDAVACTLYAINYRLAIVGVDYFAAQTPSPLQHYWSLAVEEQFYLIWPLLLLGTTVLLTSRARRARHARRAEPDTESGRAIRPGRTAVVLVILIALSFAGCVWLTHSSLPWAYFAGPTRAWELAFGALVAVGAGTLARIPSRIAAVATWIGLGAVVLSALWYDDATVFPGTAAMLPVAGTALVLAGGCAFPRRGAELVLRGSPFQWVGKLSYSWYLWHWPVLIIVPAALGFDPGVGVKLILMAAALTLAALCYLLLENPVRLAAVWRARPWRGIGLGVVLSASAAATAVVLTVVVPPPVGTGHADDLAAALSSATPAPTTPGPHFANTAPDATLETLTTAITAAAALTAAPANLTPSLVDAPHDVPPIYPDGCDPGITKITVTSPCVYGDTGSATTIVLYGDSHAGHWFPAVNIIATRHHWRLLVITKSACSPANVLINSSRLQREYTECEAWREMSMQRIAQLRPAMVVLSSRADATPAEKGDADKIWTDGWVQAVRPLVDANILVALILDTPNPKIDIPECVSTHLTDVRACITSTHNAILEPKRRSMVTTAMSRYGVTVVDPSPWFCAKGTCPSIVGNVLVYKDSSHITTVYSALLAPLLDSQIGWSTTPPAPR
jgi:peptidoglycan/LPS O-acetylase OafA/YrhL